MKTFTIYIFTVQNNFWSSTKSARCGVLSMSFLEKLQRFTHNWGLKIQRFTHESPKKYPLIITNGLVSWSFKQIECVLFLHREMFYHLSNPKAKQLMTGKFYHILFITFPGSTFIPLGKHLMSIKLRAHSQTCTCRTASSLNQKKTKTNIGRSL